jgi:hypothetical protein
MLDQGYRTPWQAVTDEYGATSGMAISRRKRIEKCLLQCHFFHHEDHVVPRD